MRGRDGWGGLVFMAVKGENWEDVESRIWVLFVWCCCKVYGLRWGSGRFCLKEIDDCMGLEAMGTGTHGDGSIHLLTSAGS